MSWGFRGVKLPSSVMSSSFYFQLYTFTTKIKWHYHIFDVKIYMVLRSFYNPGVIVSSLTVLRCKISRKSTIYNGLRLLDFYCEMRNTLKKEASLC